METYLFKFSACLAIFWLVYILFLERQKMHHFKRFYLLGAFIAALIIPILTITFYVEPTPVINNFELPNFIAVEPSFIDLQIEESPFWNLESVLWLVYSIGVSLFLIRFIVNLVKMYKRISKNETITKHSFIYVLLKECRIPHSFFKYLFFNKTTYQADTIPKEVLLHEQTHAKQLHSLDIIVIELLQIVFWFHPLIYILKHHIKLNHEFLADQAVLEQGTDTKRYQKLLLQFSSNTQEYQLSSAINYSSIKKRFTVMKTQTSKTRIWLSSLLLLPIIVILYYSFAEKEYVEKENTDILQNVEDELQKAEAYEIQYIGSGASEKLMQEYKDFIKEYTDTNTIFGSKYERAIIIYDQLMSDKQRSTVETYPKRFIPEPNLSKTKPRKLSSAQYEAFKNAKQYAIWIDSKHVSNSILSNYSANDFVHYSGSIVHKNARNEKFPQPNQYHLYTKAGFKATYQDSQLNRYKKATAKYSNAISVYLKGFQTDNLELKILKAQANKIYKTFTAEELKKHNILPVPPVPAQKSYATVQKPVMWILINRNNQFLVDDEISTLESIENKLKKLAKKGKTGQLVSIKYDNETSKDIILEVERLVKLNKFKLSSFDASKNPPSQPAIAIPKKSKGGPNAEESQDIYNPSFLEYIIEMEQLGASFYLDDEKITAKDAKSIATNNKGKSTEMLTQKDANGKYVVKLSSSIKNTHYARSIDLKILNDNSYLIDGIKATKATFTSIFNQLHQDITPEVRNKIMNIHVTSSKEISNKDVWFIYNSLIDYGFYRIVTPNQEINRAKGNTPFAIESHLSNQQKATETQVVEYNTLAKKYNAQPKDQRIVKLKDLKRLEFIYKLMSDEQKKNAQPFPECPPPPPTSKNTKGGPNTSNFQHYPIPPPIPENANPAERVKMQRAIDEFEKKYKRKVHTAKMEETGELISLIANDDVYEPQKNQEKATAKQVADYNAWAKQLNASGNKIIKRNDLKHYKYIYSIMSAEQRKASVAFPEIPPPPPPTKAKQYKNDKKKTLSEIIKETPKGVESGYELLDNGETHYYTVYKGKKTYYDKDGYITDKKGNILPPPPPVPAPPPAPESSLDFVIRMAKANAKFFYKLKPITSDKAIEILKKKPKTHINAQKTDTKQPLIYMSNKPIHIGKKGKSKN